MQEPKPEQFGITQEQFERIKSTNSKITKWLAILGILISLLISIAFVIDIVSTNYHPVLFTLVPATIIMLPVFWLGSTLTTIIILKLYFHLLKINSPIYRKFLEYESAMEEYKKTS